MGTPLKTTDGTQCGATITGCGTLRNNDLTKCDVCASVTEITTTDGLICAAKLTGCQSLVNGNSAICDVC